MFTLLEYAGALGLLAAFGLSQAGRWPTASYRYQALNTVAAGALMAAALAGGQFGFAVLNGAWAAVSAHALWMHRRAGESPGARAGRG
jgi:hypothetical protein